MGHVTRCRVLIGSHGDGEDDEVLQLEVEDPPRGLRARPQHQHAVLSTLERELVIMADMLTHDEISGNWGTGVFNLREESPKIYNP